MTDLNINKFIGNISKGLASPNKYRCKFYYGLKNSNSFTPDENSISLMCNVSALPGRNLQTVENRHYNNPFQNPYAASYPDITFSFINTNGLAERKWFESWQEIVVEPQTGLIGFRDDYYGLINIEMLSQKTGETTYTSQIMGAYPTSISEVNLGYSLQNETVISNVTFTYQHWISSN
jgi:hypothetical protein